MTPVLETLPDQGKIETEIVLVPLSDLDEMRSLMMEVPPDILLRRMADGRGNMPRKARPRMARRRKIKVFINKYFVFLLLFRDGINYLINPLLYEFSS